MNPLITIAIPVYNVEKYVERALLSALNQTYDNIEIIVVDDKGADSSMEIVNRLLKTHPRGKTIKIIDHVVNQGTGAARNTSIDNAKGEYIFFIDSDDAITDCAIETLAKHINEHVSIDLIAGSTIYIQKNNHRKAGYQKTIRLDGDMCLWQHFINTNESLHVPTWNKLYSVEFLRSSGIRCIPKQLNEDAWFTFQILFSVRKCVLENTFTYLYYINEGSTCDHKSSSIERRKFITQQYIDICHLKKEYIARFKNNSKYPQILKYVMDDCKGHCLSVIGANLAFILNGNGNLLLRKVKILIQIYNNHHIASAVKEMLTYPEDKSFIESLPKNQRKSHLDFYRLSNANRFRQLTHLVYGWFTHKITYK